MHTHYCFCCGDYSGLPDRVYCDWCLTFFGEHGRLPCRGDRQRTVIERLFAELE